VGRDNPKAPSERAPDSAAGEGRAAPPPSRTKRALFAAISILAGVAAALVLAEIGMRVLGVEPERYAPRRFAVLTKSGWTECRNWRACGINRPSPFAAEGIHMGQFTPGVTFEMIWASNPRGYFDPGDSLEYHIDAMGMRGPDVDPVKPPGTFRILGLGDSFTFGVGVREPDTFLRKLESKLRASGGRYEVLNAGTPGYNTRDEVASLKHRWLGLDPDLVLIVFYLNDAYSDSAFLNRGQELGIYLNQPQGIAKFSYLADYLQHMYRAREARREVDDYYKQHYFKDAETALKDPGAAGMDWADSRAALEEAAGIARQRGMKIALVIFPELYRLQGDYPFEAIHRLVNASAREIGIPVLDLLETFRGHDARELWVHPQDHHPNEVAHEMAAEAIERFLRANGLLSAVSGEGAVEGR